MPNPRSNQPSAPARYVDWLNERGYHPRSNKHGAALCLMVLDDLLENSPELQVAAESGYLAIGEDFDMSFGARDLGQGSGDLTWNVDLVIGLHDQPRLTSGPSPVDSFATHLIALDAKGIMTEHGKARRNRQRDLVAFSQVMRAFDSDIITCGVVPLNTSEVFDSPLRDAEPKSHPPNIAEIVDGCISLFRGVRVVEVSDGLNAVDTVGTFVIDFDNVGTAPFSGEVTDHSINDPTSEDAVSYARFIETATRLIRERFGDLIAGL